MDFLPEYRQLPIQYKILFFSSFLISGVIAGATIWTQYAANELQKGNNTISVITGAGTSDLREARAKLYAIDTGPEMTVPQQIVAYEAVAPVQGHLELVATCFDDDLCLRQTLVEHFCDDVLEFEKTVTEGRLSGLPVNPIEGEVAFGRLHQACLANQEDSK
jgi:hypothetical protein